MALKKQKQFVSDVKTIISEGRKVGKLKNQVAKRQIALKSMRGTSGSLPNNSREAAEVLANDPGMFNGGAKKKSGGYR